MTSKREGGVLRRAIRSAAQGLQIGMIAEVLSYDPSSRSGEVQPMMIDPESGERMAPLVKIPFFHMRGGPFILRAPPAAGDAAIVMVLDRSFDEWLVSGDVDAEPSISWLRNPSHAVAWVGLGPFNESVLPGVDPDDLVMGLADGSAFYSLTPGGIAVITSSDIRLGSSGASDPVVIASELNAYLGALEAAIGAAFPDGPFVPPVPPASLPILGATKVKAE